jgi:hypothetical protein
MIGKGHDFLIVEVDSESLPEYKILISLLHVPPFLLLTNELSTNKSLEFGVKKLKTDFEDILNAILHISNYKSQTT